MIYQRVFHIRRDPKYYFSAGLCGVFYKPHMLWAYAGNDEWETWNGGYIDESEICKKCLKIANRPKTAAL